MKTKVAFLLAITSFTLFIITSKAFSMRQLPSSDGSDVRKWVNSPTPQILHRADAIADNDTWTVGNDGLILQYNADNTKQSTWTKVGTSGFDNPANTHITALEVWGDSLFAGASNWDEGGSVYWYNEAIATWTPVSEPGFSTTYTNTNAAIIDMIVFNNQLYASTGWNNQAGQLWRSANGTAWNPVITDGFGNSNNTALTAFGEFNGYLYLTTHNETDGLEIWRSQTGNVGSWTQVLASGGDSLNNHVATSFLEFNGYFYASFENDDEGMGIWRTNNGINWNQVNTPGFGDANNTLAGGLGVHDGYLYIGTRNDTTSGQLWRSSNGITWEQVVGNGFGNPNNIKIDTAISFQDILYVSTENSATGVEMWHSIDGENWEQINENGFGDANNTHVLWSSGTAVHNGKFYVGTGNWASGGEVWMLPGNYNVYLPVIIK